VGSRSERRGRTKRFGRRRDDGAALVEFAFVAPLLVLILFGIIEFGVALNDYQSIRHGVRDGTRQAVVQEYGSTTPGCTSVAAPSDVQKVICLTKDRIGIGDDVRVRVEYFPESGETGDHGSVLICAQRNVDPITGLIPALEGISLKSSIQMRMEKELPASITPPVTYAEAPPSGSDWSGC
jgi:hypothetical protein